MRAWIRFAVAAGFSLCLFVALSSQGDIERKPLWDGRIPAKPSSATVHVDGRDVKIDPGEEAYPGITIQPETPWDLSKFGHVEAHIRNLGSVPLRISLRVDNDGDWTTSPWNAESASIPAGQDGTVSVIFGYSYGLKPGFKLEPSKVVRLLLFVEKATQPTSFRVESIAAAGSKDEKPPVPPGEERIKPAGGYIFGNGVVLDPATEITAEGATVANQGNRLTIKFRGKGEKVTLRPKEGAWDFRDANRISVVYTSDNLNGPNLRLESKGGPLELRTNTLASGRTETYGSYTFLPPIDLEKKASQIQLTNDAVTGLTLTSTGEATLTVDKIRIESAEHAPPAWLGRRPSVEGDWVKTLDEEFDGNRINDRAWNVVGENYYDKVTHWSKDDVIVAGGVARLRYEKKRGFQNDDPKRNETAYAAGYLDTLGKFTQKYGYFEARMKLPKAPGLWPAFWMMPDRGPSAADQGKRQFTGDGAMEFDIMEHLTRWGGMRYNIAMHYDGYEKDHKALGSDKIYVTPDKDGFLTCGLLWEPGKAVFYCNGHEVLRWENPRISNVPSDLMFTLPSGGWDNDTVDDAKLPADFVIDYVRVWKRR